MRAVGILLFDEVEVLDSTGPFEVFSVASRVSARDDGAARAPFDAFTVSATESNRARHGLRLMSRYRYSDHPKIDVLIVPGGVVDAELQNVRTIDWLRQTAVKCEVIASVCTGAFLLAQAGLLDGRRATTHWEDIEQLRALYSAVHVVTQSRWTQDGKIWTSAGIASGIDMSLNLVAKLESLSLAHRTARQMEYIWQPESAN